MKRAIKRPWDKSDVKTLRIQARMGSTARWAAAVLGRSRGAVAFKAMKLGISFHSLGRKHSRSQKLRYSKGK